MKSLAVLQPICCGSDAPPMPREAAEDLAAAFKALADPTRVGIVNRLSTIEEVCVCDLTATFELSQPTISHHLRIRRDAGLIEASSRRPAADADDERRNYYRITELGRRAATAEARRLEMLTKAARVGGLLPKTAKS